MDFLLARIILGLLQNFQWLNDVCLPQISPIYVSVDHKLFSVQLVSLFNSLTDSINLSTPKYEFTHFTHVLIHSINVPVT